MADAAINPLLTKEEFEKDLEEKARRKAEKRERKERRKSKSRDPSSRRKSEHKRHKEHRARAKEQYTKREDDNNELI